MVGCKHVSTTPSSSNATKLQKGKGKGNNPIGGLRTESLREHQLSRNFDLLLGDRKRVDCDEKQMGAEETLAEACLR